jgi:hypothetical protein
LGVSSPCRGNRHSSRHLTGTAMARKQ